MGTQALEALRNLSHRPDTILLAELTEPERKRHELTEFVVAPARSISPYNLRELEIWRQILLLPDHQLHGDRGFELTDYGLILGKLEYIDKFEWGRRLSQVTLYPDLTSAGIGLDRRHGFPRIRAVKSFGLDFIAAIPANYLPRMYPHQSSTNHSHK